MTHEDIIKQQHIALLKVCDEVRDPFIGFTEEFPDVGDVVNPSEFFKYNIKYKIDEVPYKCKFTRDEIMSTSWEIVEVIHKNYDVKKVFISVDKINGRRRRISFEGCDWKFEIVEIPEEVKLIKEYKAGKHGTLVDFLKLYVEKGYFCKVVMEHIFYDMTAKQYVEAMEEILREK